MMRSIRALCLDGAASVCAAASGLLDGATGAGARAAHRLDLAAWGLSTRARAIREGRP